jgi:hypothetical protein
MALMHRSFFPFPLSLPSLISAGNSSGDVVVLAQSTPQPKANIQTFLKRPIWFEAELTEPSKESLRRQSRRAAFDCDFNRSTQHFIFIAKRWSVENGLTEKL